MPESRPTEKSCELRLELSGCPSIETFYDVKEGLKQCLALNGHIDDPYLGGGPDFSDPRFHGKPVRLEVSSPPDLRRMAGLCTRRGADDAFGVVKVNPAVEPIQFEHDGEIIETEAVKVMLTVTADVFEAIRCQAAEAAGRHRVIWATVTLVGESLPQPENGFIFLKDLDVAELRGYAVGGFKMFVTRYTDHSRGRVLPIEPEHSEGYGVSVSILLTEARYSLNIQHAIIHSRRLLKNS